MTVTDIAMPAVDPNGRPIVGFGVILRKTGDGLSESMVTEPKFIKQGDVVYIVYEAVCIDVHNPVEDRKQPDEGGVQYVPVLDARTAVFLDEEMVRAAIDEMRDKNTERKDREEAEREAEKERARAAGTLMDPDHGAVAANARAAELNGDDENDELDADDELTPDERAAFDRLRDVGVG